MPVFRRIFDLVVGRNHDPLIFDTLDRFDEPLDFKGVQFDKGGKKAFQRHKVPLLQKGRCRRLGCLGIFDIEGMGMALTRERFRTIIKRAPDPTTAMGSRNTQHDMTLARTTRGFWNAFVTCLKVPDNFACGGGFGDEMKRGFRNFAVPPIYNRTPRRIGICAVLLFERAYAVCGKRVG